MDPYYDHLQQYSCEPPPLNTYRGEVAKQHQWRQYTQAPSDGVYMFVRFATNNGTTVNVVEQSVVLAKRAISNLGGRFVGIARKIWDLNPMARMEEAVVVFWFHSIKDAKTFFVSDPRMKQHDFPAPAGSCEAWAVVRFYTPPNEHLYSTFMISEVQLYHSSDYMRYKEEFAKKFACLLLDYDAQPFVVQSVGAEFLRRYFVPHDTLVTVHLFKNPANLAQCKKDSRWHELMTVQRDLAREHCSIFTIDPRACP